MGGSNEGVEKDNVTSFAYEFRYLQAGVSTLERYLLSDDLYWAIDARASWGEPTYPNLDLGNLLLSLVRAEAYSKDLVQDAEFAEVKSRIEACRSRWQVAWERKAMRCFTARLNLWRDYLEDYRRNAVDNLDRYAYEVRHRVMLHLLGKEVRYVRAAEQQLLHALDLLLEAVFVPGEFIWHVELAKGFPQETYWYLWGKPRQRV